MTNYFQKIFLIAICLLLSEITFSQSNKLPTSKPNIILILADDMGWADSDLYGSTYYETPNLRRLAKEGMYFTHAYAASPLCSPTRASIMSGHYPARLRMTKAITPPDVNEPKAMQPKKNQYCGDVQNKNFMPLEVYTLAEALQDTGYKTAHIGKWHLTHSENGWKDGVDKYNADYQGFDFVIGGGHLPGPPTYYSPYKNAIRNLAPGPEGEYLNERLAEESIKWIKSVKDSEQPFFLNFWHYAIHGPWVPKKDLMPKYLAKKDPQGLQNCAEMGTMIESMDTSVGMLLDWLDLPANQELKNNTLIVFASDNGGVAHLVKVNGKKRQVTSNRPLRGGKGNTYEGGTRIPWIVRWPGKVVPGSISETPISTIDLYPTLLEVAGTKPKAAKICDGQSLVPVFKGKTIAERPLFFDFPHVFGAMTASSASVRLGDYKLLRFYWAGEKQKSHYYELFNLKKDPYEAVNLASYMPEKVKELDALISEHLKVTNALIPVPNKNFTGNPLKSRSGKERAPNRPASMHLAQKKFKAKEAKGSQKFQLLDENGKAIATAAVVLEGAEWIQIKPLSDGQVELAWDRSQKKEDATILFGWKGGISVLEMNDWTNVPVELKIR